MTKRLEEALKRLTPEQIEQLTKLAENLAPQPSTAPRFLKLDWVGKAAGLYPEYKAGVDAAHAAGKMWRDATERSLAK